MRNVDDYKNLFMNGVLQSKELQTVQYIHNLNYNLKDSYGEDKMDKENNQKSNTILIFSLIFTSDNL